MVRTAGALSSLGLSTGRNDFDGTELLIAMKCYFDGSEGKDKHGDSWVTLAGFAAHDESWKGFDSIWRSMLRERYPMAPYVHMWEIISGTDPFERVNGWTKDKVLALISDAVDLLTNWSGMHSLRPFSCRVNLSAKERIAKDGYSVQDPMSICAGMCIALAMDSLIVRRPELCYVFFDRGERFMAPFKTEWLAKRTPPGRLSTDQSKTVWDIIHNIIDADTETEPSLQAADMIAWATSRDIANKLGELYDLDEYMGKLITEHHAVIDEQLLREKYIIPSPASVGPIPS